MIETLTFKAKNNKTVVVDAALWQEALDRTSKKGDGRLGVADAHALFDLIARKQQYTEIDKKTLKHIRKQFHWTKQGNIIFRRLIRSAAGKNWSPGTEASGSADLE